MHQIGCHVSRQRNPPKDIVYKKITSRFFVVSSFRNDKIWYDRCNFAASLVNCVLINYPAAEKLGLVGRGIAKVKLEVVREQKETAS